MSIFTRTFHLPFIFRYYIMFSRFIFILFAAVFLQVLQIKAQTIPIPDTPAGKHFSAWLTVFNSGNGEAIKRFVVANFDKTFSPDEIADNHAGLFENDGRFEVQKITDSAPGTITVLVRANPTGYWLEIKLEVAAESLQIIKSFRYQHIPMPAEMLPRKKLSDREIRANLDALMKTMVKADLFSGAILVARNGKPIYRQAFGLASRAWKIPNRTDTKFNIASISKMLTATAILQLVEQNKLALDDPIGKILPDYPHKDVAQKVTVHHLLTHTSGLQNKSLSQFNRRFRKLQDYLPSFAGEPFEFEPGERYDYSNDGYLLLGLIIEKASGQDYYDYVREHIYKLAGMSDSDSYELDSDPPNLATGYMNAPNKSRRSNIFTLPVKGLSYGLTYSTVEDLLKFHVALENNRLLKASSLETAWQGKVTSFAENQYGYGFDVTKYNGTKIVGHSGGWYGITNQMEMYPELGYTVVILTNYDDLPKPIAMKLREWLTQGNK